jgi:hypothetical protein
MLAGKRSNTRRFIHSGGKKNAMIWRKHQEAMVKW